MPQTITTGYKALVEAAEREIETLPTEEAIKLAGRDDTVLDRHPRHPRIAARGQGARRRPLPARHAGILDRSAEPLLQAGVRRRTRNTCSSAPAACARRLPRRPRTRMGLKPVAHIKGGFGAWKKAGGPVRVRQRRGEEALTVDRIARPSAKNGEPRGDGASRTCRMALTLIIGNKNYSSWSLRPWIAMKVAGIAFEEKVIPLYEPGSREQVLRYSPGRQGAGADRRRRAVWESLAILEYLAEKISGGETVAGTTRRARSHARVGGDRDAWRLPGAAQELPDEHVAAGEERGPQPDEVMADVRRIDALWADCRARFGQGGPFLFGAFGAADAMYAPVVARFHSYGMPVSDDDACLYGRGDGAAGLAANGTTAALKETWIMRAQRAGLAAGARPRRCTQYVTQYERRIRCRMLTLWPPVRAVTQISSRLCAHTRASFRGAAMCVAPCFAHWGRRSMTGRCGGLPRGVARHDIIRLLAFAVAFALALPLRPSPPIATHPTSKASICCPTIRRSPCSPARPRRSTCSCTITRCAPERLRSR